MITHDYQAELCSRDSPNLRLVCRNSSHGLSIGPRVCHAISNNIDPLGALDVSAFEVNVIDISIIGEVEVYTNRGIVLISCRFQFQSLVYC